MKHNFKCECCGYCCTFNVVLTEKEIANIKSQGYSYFFVKEKDSNNNDKRFILKREKNGDCLFLERKNNRTSCKIYPLRPSPCKNYPPYPQNQSCKEFNPRVRAYLYGMETD